MDTKTDWFSSWFNTPYYHILYKNRNEEDAKLFMQNLTDFLALQKNAHIADLPCGKGRHAIFLNSLGYRVFGGDLSTNSIKQAKQFENKTLQFAVCDIRNPLSKKYDAIFNLFTSFGYFEDDLEDIKVLKNFKDGLQNNGVLVVDFLNVYKVKNNLVKQETKSVDGIDFNIQRTIKDEFIFKNITFTIENKTHNYTEKVKYITLKKWKEYITKSGLQLVNTFGDYQLNPFDLQSSNRLILILKK